MPELDDNNEVLQFNELLPERGWIIAAIRGTEHFPQTNMGTLVFTLAKMMEQDDWVELLEHSDQYAPSEEQIDQLAHAMNAVHARNDIRSFTQSYLDEARGKIGTPELYVNSKVVDLENVAAIWNEVVRANLPFLYKNIRGEGSRFSKIRRNLLEVEGGAEEVKGLVELIKERLEDASLKPMLAEYKMLLKRPDSGKKGRAFAKQVVSRIKNEYEANLGLLKVLTPEEALAIFDYLA